MSASGHAAAALGAVRDAPASRPIRRHLSRFGAVYRIGLPIALWVVFADSATHYRDRHLVLPDGLREVVEAEVASRHCPGLRLDETSFRRFAQERGLNHADLYQKRSVVLRKDAAAVERDLRADPDRGCRHMLDLYGGDGDVPHLLVPTRG